MDASVIDFWGGRTTLRRHELQQQLKFTLDLALRGAIASLKPSHQYCRMRDRSRASDQASM